MNAIDYLFLAISVSAVIAYSGLLPAINETESKSIRDSFAVNEICTKIKCQGDFPVSSARRYAEAERDAWNRSIRL